MAQQQINNKKIKGSGFWNQWHIEILKKKRGIHVDQTKKKKLEIKDFPITPTTAGRG